MINDNILKTDFLKFLVNVLSIYWLNVKKLTQNELYHEHFSVIRRDRNSYFCSENLWITLPVQNTVTWFLWAVYGKCWLSLQMFGVIRHCNLVVAPPFQAHFHDPIQKQMENLEYDIRHIQQYKIIYSSTISSIY